jgi:hypothetical protein
MALQPERLAKRMRQARKNKFIFDMMYDFKSAMIRIIFGNGCRGGGIYAKKRNLKYSFENSGFLPFIVQ